MYQNFAFRRNLDPNFSTFMKNSGNEKPGIPGLCGLSNLGNTDAMNVALQCLLKVEPFRDYFLSGEYKKEINRDNPLGFKGKVAESFGNIMELYWSGNSTVLHPGNFKTVIGEQRSTFAGYSQQDSMEIVSFVLDSLHEDLNRILKKPITPHVGDIVIGTKSNEEVAEESYLKRNQSIVLDNFHGQLRSEVTCPKCKVTTFRFDPYIYLSLPIPGDEINLYETTVFTLEDETPKLHEFLLKKSGNVSDLRMKVSETCGIPSPKRLVICDIFNGHVHHFLKDGDGLDQILPREKIVVYEISEEIEVDQQQREEEEQRGHNNNNNNNNNIPLFGVFTIKGEEEQQQQQEEEPEEEDGSLKKLETTFVSLLDYPILKPLVSTSLAQQQGGGGGQQQKQPLSFQKIYDSVLIEMKKYITEDGEKELLERHGLDIFIDYDNNNSFLFPPSSSSSSSSSTTTEEEKNEKKKKSVFLFTIHQVFSSEKKICPYSDTRYPFDDNDVIDVDSVGGDYVYFNNNNLRQIRIEFEVRIPISFLEYFQFQKRILPPPPPEQHQKKKKKKDVLTLSHCLKSFAEKKMLDKDNTWYCSRCKDHFEATVKTEIWTAPKTLIVQLLRFVTSSDDQQQPFYQHKKETYVDFPLQLDLTPFIRLSNKKREKKYQLFGVINHYGGLGGGHHVCFCRCLREEEQEEASKIRKRWYSFDDSFARELKKGDSIVSCASYVLFYQECEERFGDLEDERVGYLRKKGRELFLGGEESTNDSFIFSIFFTAKNVRFENCLKIFFF